MTKFTATLNGLIELRKKLEQTSEDLVGGEMLQAIRKVTLMVLRDAKLLAPRDTGHLANSLTAKVESGGDLISGNTIRGVVGSNVKHAPFMEMGTKPHWPPLKALERWAKRHGVPVFLVARAIAKHGTKPRRFLQGAFERHEGRIKDILGEVVKKVVKK